MTPGRAHIRSLSSYTLAMLVWLDGDILPAERARISVLDRGFLFGDGVYEMIRVISGVPLRLELHADRLRLSLAQTRINGFDTARLAEIVDAILSAERLPDATVYVQVTRGAMENRRHLPEPGMCPTVVAFAMAAPGLDRLGAPMTCRAALLPDMRWSRCAIKATSLLGNVLGVMEADDLGADEAILFRRGVDGAAGGNELVGEGATSNVWAVVDGSLVTPPIDSDPPILHGITRHAALDAATRIGLPLGIAALTVRDLRAAPEILLTSARRLVASVVELDGAVVGNGAPGTIATALAAAMRDDIAALVTRHTARTALQAVPTEIPTS